MKNLLSDHGFPCTLILFSERFQPLLRFPILGDVTIGIFPKIEERLITLNRFGPLIGAFVDGPFEIVTQGVDLDKPWEGTANSKYGNIRPEVKRVRKRGRRLVRSAE